MLAAFRKNWDTAMQNEKQQLALIVGAGSGLSGSLARQCAAAGMRVVLAARNTAKLKSFAGAELHACDAADPAQVAKLFAAIDAPDLVVYNPSYRARGPFISLDPQEVHKTLMVTAYGGFLVAQAAAKRMLERGRGSLFFTGASASVKGYAESAPFAMGKFALRGLAQSLARELGPKGIHVAHFIIDGGILRAGSDARAAERGEDGMLLPDAIAQTYLDVHRQHRSAWSFEVDLRPWKERF
jgi:NAD(P)-dependent dehydrogenase (short-subunit alcohol dehydrogenase family)